MMIPEEKTRKGTKKKKKKKIEKNKEKTPLRKLKLKMFSAFTIMKNNIMLLSVLEKKLWF